MSVTDLVPVPANINQGVTSARQATMLSLLGSPRQSYDDQCREVTDARLAAMIVYQEVGPLKARGIAPAIESLGVILADIEREEPEVYQALGHAGMLCVRYVRGSATSISNHSWGTAIDLNLNANLDTRGDNRVQEGLTRIAPIFNHHGWYWGAGFRTEDAMHFECGDELIRRWHNEGRFGEPSPQQPRTLSLGDRGSAVRRLQERLNELGAQLVIDGDFGRGTHAAVMAFQASRGLDVDGVVGPRTREALGMV